LKQHKTGVILLTVLAGVLSATQARTAAVCGTVDDVNRQAVKGAVVTVKSSSGSTLGRATTDENGNYRIDNLNLGSWNIFFQFAGAGFRDGSGALDLNDKTKRVNWRVSAFSAVAKQDGPCVDAITAHLEWGSIAPVVFSDTGFSASTTAAVPASGSF
jgi:hypothetical protein